MGSAAVRYVTGLFIGGAVALFLLWLMQYLIATGENVLDDKKRVRFMDFVRVEKNEQVERKDRKPKQPPKPEQAPPDMPQPQQEQLNPSGESIYVAPVAVSGAGVSVSGFGLEASDGEYLPIVKVAPVYPRRAQQRGLTGYCTVEYTVTTLGTVENPTVVECSSSLFERSSINAALKFKYKPRVVDGEPISVGGVQNRFTYVLDE